MKRLEKHVAVTHTHTHNTTYGKEVRSYLKPYFFSFSIFKRLEVVSV